MHELLKVLFLVNSDKPESEKKEYYYIIYNIVIHLLIAQVLVAWTYQPPFF